MKVQQRSLLLHFFIIFVPMDAMIHIFSVLPLIVCSFWTVIVFLDNVGSWKKYDRLSLFLFLLVTSLLYLGHAVHFNVPVGSVVLTDCIYAGANLAVYPLFYLYVSQLTNPSRLHFQAYWPLIPSLLVFAYSLYEFYSGGSQETTHFLNRALFPVTVIFSCIGVFLRIRIHNELVNNLYSNTEKKTFRRFYLLMGLLVFASLASVVLNRIGREYFENSFLMALPSIFFSILLFAIAYIGSNIEFSAQDAVVDFPEEPVMQQENRADGLVALSARIDAFMAESEIYCQPDLKISDLAEAVGSNRTYVSNALNSIKGLSFSDYVNGFRIAKAKALLLEGNMQNMTMVVIAEQSGFVSESTFYRHFKALTGMTPTAWLRGVKA